MTSTGTHGYIAQWLERLTADQQVPGSNPGVPSCLPLHFLHEWRVAQCLRSQILSLLLQASLPPMQTLAARHQEIG